jgi:hypothetical protein
MSFNDPYETGPRDPQTGTGGVRTTDTPPPPPGSTSGGTHTYAGTATTRSTGGAYDVRDRDGDRDDRDRDRDRYGIDEAVRDRYVAEVGGWPRRDRISWGPVWAGFIITLGTYLLLQLMLITSGLVDLVEGDPATAGWWSAGAAVVAFLLGGVVAGAGSHWTKPSDGLLNGIVMWGLALVALLLIGTAGGGIAVGAFDIGNVIDEFTAGVDTQQTVDTTREAAGWTLIGLTVALAASAIGGAIGTTLWPREPETHENRGLVR